VVLALAWLTSPAGADVEGAPCLSGRVTGILSAKMTEHAFDDALPAGWTFQQVHVASARIDLGVVDAQGRLRYVALRLGGAAGVVDGRGRWFWFAIDDGGAPLDTAGRQRLLALAARVEAAVPEDEALRICAGPSSSSGPSGPMWLPVGMAFYALAIVGALLAVWRCRRHLLSREALVPAVLTGIGLGVRFVAHPIVGDIRPVLGAGLALQQYRAGWSALLHLLFALLPPRYETVWAVHRVVGALAVPLLYVALRQRFPQRAVAAAGAAALAVVPLAARFSASDTPYVPLCTALLGSVVALTCFRRSGSRGALGLGLVLLTAAMHLRPDGPWLVVPVALLVLTVPAVPTGRTFSPATVIAGSLFLAANVPPSIWAVAGQNRVGDGSLAAFMSGHEFVLFGTVIGSPWTDMAMSPWPLSLLVGGGLVVAATTGRSGVGWVAATLVATPFASPATAQYANARYHLPAVYLACGLAGVAAAYLVESAGRRLSSRLDTAVIAAALVLVAAVPRLDLLRRMWTPQMEFEFYRAGRRQVGSECAVVALTAGRDAGFVPFSDPGVAAPTDISDLLAAPAPPPGECLVYYRGANCQSADTLGQPNGAPFDENPACRELERRATLVPIAEASLPARPYRGERYSVDPVPVGYYRIVSLAPGTPAH
jgi:hypothetical protein